MALEQVLYRLYGQVAGGNSLVGDVAFADTSALQDPLVGGIYHGFEVLVAQYSRRDIGSQRRNLGTTAVSQ